MIEFNSDGSLKLPSHLQQKKDRETSLLNNAKCIKVERELVSEYAPKECHLIITPSKNLTDKRFITNIFIDHAKNLEVPLKLSKHDQGFKVVVCSHFKRCSTCCALIGKYRSFLDGNLIEKKGRCSFENYRKNFTYEDYFD
ncbi:MAG: hypothetical protein ACOC1K_03860 [Nanoarchaeota archaeon]